MEFVKGETLRNKICDRGRLPMQEAMIIAEQLCSGLAAAHEAGVVHRDFKSSNVLLTVDGNRACRAVITISDLRKHCLPKTGTNNRYSRADRRNARLYGAGAFGRRTR